MDSECGLVLFDLHGEVVESIVAAAAADGRFSHLPIVIIDCANRTTTVKYNPLARHEIVEPSVTAKRMVEAVMHAFGDLDPMQMPTTQRIMTTAFHAAIEGSLTLPQIPELFSFETHVWRAEIASRISDVRTRNDLLRLNGLTRARYEEETLPLLNRVSAMSGTRLTRAMFGHTDGCFTWDWALEAGAIVLVSLATSGGTITETDAKWIASVMLTDLWQAAQRRGKAPAGMRRPFYVYIDEAPFVSTPTIALQLPQARGFGLHFTIAAQATSQFEDFGGEHGRAIRKAVLRDTLTKLIFAQTAEKDDIEPFSYELALSCYDPYLLKHTTPTFQVTGEEEEEYWTVGHAIASGHAEGENEVVARSLQRSRSRHWASTRGSASAFGTNWAYSTSEGVVTPELLAAETYEGRITHVDTSGFGFNEQSSVNKSKTDGGSELDGEGTNIALGKQRQTSDSVTETRQQHKRWRPIIERIENPLFFSFDEQQKLWEQRLVTMHKRHALLSTQGLPPVEIASPDVNDPEYMEPEWIDEFLADFRAQPAQQSFWSPIVEATTSDAATAALASETRLRSFGRRAAPAPGEGPNGNGEQRHE